MKDYFKILRRFLYTLELILTYAIQRIPDSLLYFFTGTRSIYLLGLAFVITILEGEKVGFVFSLISGMITDLDSSYQLGFYTIIIPIISIILAKLFEKTLNINLISASILISIFIFIIYSMEFVIFSVFTKHHELLFEFYDFYTKKILCTCASIPVFYLFNRTISIFFRKSFNNRSSDDNEN